MRDVKRATSLFDSEFRSNVARQVGRFCCSYYLQHIFFVARQVVCGISVKRATSLFDSEFRSNVAGQFGRFCCSYYLQHIFLVARQVVCGM